MFFFQVDALRGVGIRQIACGSGHTVVLTTDGEVFTWGKSFCFFPPFLMSVVADALLLSRERR